MRGGAIIEDYQPRKTFERVRDLRKIMKQTQQSRGELSENLVFSALRKIAREGEITKFYKTEKYGREDTVEKADFVIFTLEGERKPLQVKSSKRGVEKHSQGDYSTPAIYVDPTNTDEQIVEKIKSVLDIFPIYQ